MHACKQESQESSYIIAHSANRAVLLEWLPCKGIKMADPVNGVDTALNLFFVLSL